MGTGNHELWLRKGENNVKDSFGKFHSTQIIPHNAYSCSHACTLALLCVHPAKLRHGMFPLHFPRPLANPNSGAIGLTGKVKYLESICQELGVHVKAKQVGGVWICPILSWYHEVGFLL